MHPRVDLSLIRQSLQALNDSTYFDRKLHDFTSRLIDAIDHVLGKSPRYDDVIERQFAAHMRLVQSYLSGSTTNEIPYEVVFCLKDALKRWTTRETLIITHLTSNQDFHFVPADPWQFISQSLTDFDPAGFNSILVLIGVPRLYAHKPVFCMPLYHELGHFVDISNNISEISTLLAPSPIAPNFGEINHRREFFADLFSACFVARAGVSALEAIAPSNGASFTHPSTSDRVSLVERFLGSQSDPVVDMFQSALAIRKLPALAPIGISSPIEGAFDDLRTFTAASIEEVHGLFGSAWNYIFDTSARSPQHWATGAIPGRIEATVNDLTEKSIRNFAIRESWNATSH